MTHTSTTTIDPASNKMTRVATRSRTLYWTLLFAFVLVPVVNFAVPFLPGGSQQFSDYGSTRVDAAPYAFSIWTAIFIGMIGFAIRLVNGKEPDTRSVRMATISLLVAGIASIVFVPISLYASDTVTFLDIVLHLIALVFAAYWLRRHVRETRRIDIGISDLGRMWFYGPSMYLAWISAATVISTALMLRDQQVDVPAEFATAVACCTLGMVTTIALLMLKSRDVVYAGTIVWALVAIGIQQAAFPPVRWTAWVTAGLLFVAIALRLANPPSFYSVTRVDVSK